MKVLGIRQPWAAMVAAGIKTVEVRSYPTRVRGRIAIYATRTQNAKRWYDWCDIYTSGKIDHLPHGYILCTADLVDCAKVTSFKKYVEDIALHCNHPDLWYEGGCYYWVLKNIEPVHPIEYKFKGNVVWGGIDHAALGGG